MADLKIAKPSTDAEKKTQTTTDTWEFTAATAKTWRSPPFQRPLRVNDKVTSAAAEIKESDGVISGTFTIGVFEKERWLVDGQHRREAFYLSGCPVGYVDVRIIHFDSMADMADEFVRVNSRLVNLKPDDIVRGMEASCEPIAKLRRKCNYGGYDNVRRNERSPVIAMSQLLRCWNGSANDTPRTGGVSAAQLAELFTTDDCEQLASFMDCAYTAWGRDPQNYRLWSSLNLTLCAWIYRRIHLTAYSAKTQRVDRDLFTKCLLSVSAAEIYVAWLMGRQLSPRDLAPAYAKLKGLFSSRIEKETGRKAYLPAPTWSTHA
jgi:hypothetical protein